MKTTVEMHHARTTKNTYRFEEDGPEDQHKIGVLYVQQKTLGWTQPKGISVTIETKD